MTSPPAKKQKRQLISISREETQNHGRENEQRDGMKTTSVENTQNSRSAISGPHKRRDSRPRQRTVHSFFNARTRAQTQSKKHKDANVTLAEDIENIEVEDDAGCNESFAQGGLKHERRSENVTSTSINNEDGLADTRSLAETGSDVKLFSTRAAQSLSSDASWADKFRPQNLNELAVHRKKISEVATWLQNALIKRPFHRLLILKGPSGSGKSTTVRLLADSYNALITEWQNPARLKYGEDGYISLTSQFDEFLNRGTQFSSLSLSSPCTNTDSPGSLNQVENVVVLVDDFPSSIQSAPHALTSVRKSFLLNLETENGNPTVAIFSEEEGRSFDAAGTADARSLLGTEILSHPATSVIEFNRLAPTFMTTALNLVVRKEARASGRRNTPTASTLRSISQTGDLRNAIGLLQMLCIDGSEGALKDADPGEQFASDCDSFTITETTTKSLQRFTQRDSLFGLFHAVGKVIYNKRQREAPIQPPDYLSEQRRLLESDVDIDDLSSRLGTDCSTFIAALHENYVPSCNSTDPINAIEKISYELSSADIIGSVPRHGKDFMAKRLPTTLSIDFLRLEDLACQVAVRGVLFALPFPVKRVVVQGSKSHNGILFPALLRLNDQQKDMRSHVETWQHGIALASKTRINYANSQFHSSFVPSKPENNSHTGTLSFNDFGIMTYPSSSDTLLYRMPYAAKIPSTDLSYTARQALTKVVAFDNFAKHSSAPDAGLDNFYAESDFQIRSVPGRNYTNAGTLTLSDDDIDEF